MVRRSLRSAAPTKAWLWVMRLVVMVLHKPARLGLARVARISVGGRRALPRNEPVLIICNHVGFMDPVILVAAAQRPIQFLAAPSVMQEKFLAYLMAFFGVVPKAKFSTDLVAIKTLKRWCDLGATVGLFPEGQRTWDGRPLPLLPGIEKLVRLFGVPVVTARILNADRQSPYWAASMRRGRIRVQFDPPVRFPRGTPLEQIRAAISTRIRVDPATSPRWPVRGIRLAAGITNLLFSCPRCSILEGLLESDDTVACQSCGAAWRVTTENKLLGIGSAPSMWITEAVDRIRHALAKTWRPDPGLFEEKGAIMESEPMRLLEVSDQSSSLVATGRLLLSEDQLATDGWSLPLHTVTAVAVDVRRRLQFRTKASLFEPVMQRESVMKWVVLIEHWRQVARKERNVSHG